MSHLVIWGTAPNVAPVVIYRQDYDFRVEKLERKYTISDTKLVVGTLKDAENQTLVLLYNTDTKSL